MPMNLPAPYMITGSFSSRADFQHKLEKALLDGPKVVQLRCKDIPDDEYLEMARLAREICQRHQAPLILTTSVENFLQSGADGLYLSSKQLADHRERPIPGDKLLAISCHTESDLEQANSLGANLMLLSPVKPTAAHPDLPGLGWSRFQEMTHNLSQPVYGFGGMQPEDMSDALAAGARGIATKSYWP
ncbi:thiamine phosphate synthase [Thiolapillus sp.]